MDRIVFLGTPINDDVSNIIIAQLLFLDADNPERDIYLYINSPGGIVSSGMAIYDTLQFLRAPVKHDLHGHGASMGSFLLAAGRKGKRSAFAPRPHHDAPTVGRHAGHGVGYRDPGARILYLRGKLTNCTPSTPARPSNRSKKTWIATVSCRPRKRRNTASSTTSSRTSRRWATARRPSDPLRWPDQLPILGRHVPR